VCDGTAAGTTLVSTVKPIGFPVVHNSELIFSVNPSFSIFELWKSNGTAAGTQMIGAQGPFDFSTPSLVVAGNDVYFVPGLTNQLHRLVFGTTGATGVQPVNADLSVYFDIIPALAPAGNRLIVAASANGEPKSLWITDGTPGGTTAVVPPEEFGTDIGQRTSYASAPATVQMASMGSKLLLITPNESDAEFWHTDGTADGTHLRYVGIDGGRPASRIFRVEDSHLFVLEYANQAQEVWISRRGRLPVPFRELSGHVVGNAERIVGSSGSFALVEVYASTFGSQLWRTDGTSSGTKLLTTMPYPPGDRLFSAFAGDGLVYFSVGGFRLWRSNGTSAGTYEIATGVSVGSGDIHGSPTPHVQYGNEEFFFVNGGSNTGLWATDGTPVGTRPIHGVPSIWSVEGFGAAVVAGKVVFTGHSAAEGVELWISDGTPGGTQLLADLAPGATSSHPSDFVNYEGRLYFFARTPANGRELWVSDGTSAGTHIVKDIMPGEFSSMPEDLIAAGGALYFKAWTREHGAELWRSDGTEAGTRMLADIAPGIGGSSPTRFTRAGNRLYFLARTDEHGVELYSVRVAQDESDDDSGCAAGGNPSGNAMLVLLSAALLAAARFRGRLVAES
jgi:ELWxxDGT repeat protein